MGGFFGWLGGFLALFENFLLVGENFGDVCFLLMREINEVDWSNKLSVLYLKA